MLQSYITICQHRNIVERHKHKTHTKKKNSTHHTDNRFVKTQPHCAAAGINTVLKFTLVNDVLDHAFIEW